MIFKYINSSTYPRWTRHATRKVLELSSWSTCDLGRGCVLSGPRSIFASEDNLPTRPGIAVDQGCTGLRTHQTVVSLGRCRACCALGLILWH